MGTRLDKALEAVRKLPLERQEEIAAVIETAVQEPAYTLTPDQVRELEDAIKEADAGHFATDEEVQNLFARFGRV
ncbi:MAG: hypothetical protein H6842_05415 [Rhodospirillaceae bacterium]|nr:hypothetical protein [Rhodospirillaceae bacterium]